jgi:predicted nucleotidyltransferase
MNEALTAVLRNDRRARFGYLFGSRAQGTQRLESDVDVAVWLDVDPAQLGEVALELADTLSAATRVDTDVVVLNRAPVLLRWKVITSGQLLLERDRTERVSFESLTMQQAIDFEPIRRRCAAGLVRQLQQEVESGR